MISGCIGFSYIHGRLIGHMLLVRGKRVVNIPLPYPLLVIMSRLWTRKNILGKFLFKKNEDWNRILTSKKLKTKV